MEVRRLRREKKWTQEFLGHESGLGQGAISAIEIGKVQPTMDSVTRLARALDVNPREFAALAGHLDADAERRLDDAEERIWRAIWNNRPLSAQLRRAMRHESEEEYQHLLDRSFELTAKSLEIDLDELERRRGDAAPVPVGPN